MLVLSRKRGDAVAMGDRGSSEHVIKVTVLDICGSQVKLGFEAGNNIAVHRWEVWQRINDNEGKPPQDRPAPEVTVDGWEDDGGPANRARRNRRPPAPSG